MSQARARRDVDVDYNALEEGWTLGKAEAEEEQGDHKPCR